MPNSSRSSKARPAARSPLLFRASTRRQLSQCDFCCHDSHLSTLENLQETQGEPGSLYGRVVSGDRACTHFADGDLEVIEEHMPARSEATSSTGEPSMWSLALPSPSSLLRTESDRRPSPSPLPLQGRFGLGRLHIQGSYACSSGGVVCLFFVIAERRVPHSSAPRPSI